MIDRSCSAAISPGRLDGERELDDRVDRVELVSGVVRRISSGSYLMQFVERTKVVRDTNYMREALHVRRRRPLVRPPAPVRDRRDPRGARRDEPVVDVLAAGLHPRVRSTADGSHYTSGGELPLIPGIDGVGRTPDGELVYFVLPDTPLGTMAEQTVVDRRAQRRAPAGQRPDRRSPRR